MIKLNAPQTLNGSQLKKELIAGGVIISTSPDSIEIDGNGDLWLEIAESDKAKAKAIVDAHIGLSTPKVLTIEEKLETIGLSLNELKAAISA